MAWVYSMDTKDTKWVYSMATAVLPLHPKSVPPVSFKPAADSLDSKPKVAVWDRIGHAVGGSRARAGQGECLCPRVCQGEHLRA
eukprot:scaffold71337_cov66-Phaeocystis_antarctica.AAC.1